MDRSPFLTSTASVTQLTNPALSNAYQYTRWYTTACDDWSSDNCRVGGRVEFSVRAWFVRRIGGESEY